MFIEDTWEHIISAIKKKEKACLEVILRTPRGPRIIQSNFENELKSRGIKIASVVNWWSASSSFGALEIEIEDGFKVYAIWNLGEKNEVLKITPKDEVDLDIIIDSLASSNVAPGVMRTFSHSRFPGG